MPLEYSHPFSGAASATCSYTAHAMAEASESLIAKGMSEADFEKAKLFGEWGKWKAKIANEDVAPGTVLFRGKSILSEFEGGDGVATADWTAVFTKSEEGLPKIKMLKKVNGRAKGDPTTTVSMFEEHFLYNEGKTAVKWSSPGAPGPAVPAASPSFGKLADEDVAAMFVKTKDELAKSKGILDLKGVNVALDNEVYDALASFTGYTGQEVKAKIERYKANGNKLSGLKKKVLSGKKTVPDVPISGAKPAAVDGWEAKAQASKLVDPTVEPAQETVDKVVEAVSAAVEDGLVQVYEAEDVVAAYIKAKDDLAASEFNPWTLYTKSDEFDNAIYSAMEKHYGISLSPKEIRKTIAQYVADGNKVSVLKKKLIAKGELQPKADTLKKPKAKADTAPAADAPPAAPATDGASVDAANGAAGVPAGSTGPEPAFDWTTLPPNEQQWVFDSFKGYSFGGPAYLTSDPKFLYEKALSVISTGKSSMGYLTGMPDADVMTVLKIVDHIGAQKFQAENAFLYEKKVVEWAQSPQARDYMLAKQQVAELLKNMPDLPPDSSLFRVFSPDDARAMQREMGGWTDEQKTALTTYTGSAYHEMNGALRGGRVGSSAYRSAIEAAKAGMKPITQNMIVHRGCDFQQFGLKSFEEAVSLVGKFVVDDGFLSTSVGGQAAFSGQVMIEAQLPVGTKGAFVKDISRFQHENEFIVNPGTRFRVLRVERDPYGRVKVYVRAEQ